MKWLAKLIMSLNDGLHGICLFGKAYFKYPNPSPELVAHENVHVKQQKEYGSVKWLIKYLTNHDFRLMQEVEAYKVSISLGLSEEVAVEYLTSMYFLRISKADAYKLFE